MTYADLYAHIGALETFAKRDLPFRIAIAAGRRVKLVREAIADVEEQRKRLLEQHAQRGDDGEMKIVGEGAEARVALADTEAFEKDFETLLHTEVESAFAPIDVKDTDKMPDLPANEAAALLALGLLDD